MFVELLSDLVVILLFALFLGLSSFASSLFLFSSSLVFTALLFLDRSAPCLVLCCN